MPKAKLGVSMGLLCAAVYFAALFGSYMALILVAGYILLFEENTWLRQSAMKAFAVAVLFDLAVLLLGFVPDTLGIINQLADLFDSNIDYSFISQLVYLLQSILRLGQKVVLVILGIKAMRLGTMAFKPVDNVLQKHI